MDFKNLTPKCSGQMFLGVLIICGFFVALWYILAHEIPQPNHDLVVFLLGVLAGFGGSVVSFYYGSSSTPPKPPEATKVSVVQTQEQTDAH